jgi:TRAP transporter TAXI family solute receptor
MNMKPVGARLATLLSFVVVFAPMQLRAAPPPGWPPTLTIGTASPGGGYIVYGQALAKLLTEALGLPVSAQSTQGADQNIVLLEAGQVQLGLVTMGPALQAWNGTGEWTHDKKYRALRAILPMYDGPFQMVALKDSGIHSVADMAGKRIGTGPRGGTTHSYFTAAFKALNIPVAIRNGAYSELTSQFEQHQVDVLASVIGSPVPFLVALDRRVQLDHIAFTPDEMATLRQAMPELSPSRVPAGTYASMTSDYQSVGLYNFTVAHKDLPDDLVYAIVKATFEHRERLIAAYPSATETLAANVSRNGFLPFHPGAVRYYREIGVAIPDNLAKVE